ncbi:MAG TPA: hypothetical protein DEV81_21590 [Cyanobacteria bacterium UBA11049]|nr:hypothetical protein [Cyanobacteria bacterium UBA11049]
MSNNDFDRYYKILGLKPGASLLEIKQAYRNLAKTQHPDLFDRNPQLKRAAEEKFKKITEAYIKLKKFHRFNTANSFATSRTKTTTSSQPANSFENSSRTKTTTSSQPANSSATSGNRNSTVSNLRRYLNGIIPIAIGINVIFLVYIVLNNSNLQNNYRPQNNPLTQPNFTPQPIPPSQTAAISVTAQQCRVVVPTVGNSVRVFTQPSKDAYTGKRILKDTKVSFIGGRGEFVEIKLADGTSGWVFSDRIYPCKVQSDSRSQIASISEQPQQSLIIAPTAGRGARIFTQPSRNAYLGRRIPQDTKVSLLREQQEFVEIKLPDNTQGWVFNDQVHPYTVPDSSLQVASVSVTAQQCRLLTPTIGNSARVFTQPSRDAYTGKRIPKDSKVSFISGRGEFVEIKLADGTSGWVFNDQISPCEVRSDSRSQIASISEQPQQCLAIASSVTSGARIFTQPSRNAYIGRRIPQGTKVTSIGEQQEFVKIRLADGTYGWVFNDQVNPCTAL